MVELVDFESNQLKEVFDTLADWEAMLTAEKVDLGGRPS